MHKPSSQLLQLVRRRAGFTLHQLLDEIQLLTVAFPDLRDAFDPDELPIAFILKRGSGIPTEPDPTPGEEHDHDWTEAG